MDSSTASKLLLLYTFNEIMTNLNDTQNVSKEEINNVINQVVDGQTNFTFAPNSVFYIIVNKMIEASVTDLTLMDEFVKDSIVINQLVSQLIESLAPVITGPIVKLKTEVYDITTDITKRYQEKFDTLMKSGNVESMPITSFSPVLSNMLAQITATPSKTTEASSLNGQQQELVLFDFGYLSDPGYVNELKLVCNSHGVISSSGSSIPTIFDMRKMLKEATDAIENIVMPSTLTSEDVELLDKLACPVPEWSYYGVRTDSLMTSMYFSNALVYDAYKLKRYFIHPLNEIIENNHIHNVTNYIIGLTKLITNLIYANSGSGKYWSETPEHVNAYAKERISDLITITTLLNGVMYMYKQTIDATNVLIIRDDNGYNNKGITLASGYAKYVELLKQNNIPESEAINDILTALKYFNVTNMNIDIKGFTANYIFERRDMYKQNVEKLSKEAATKTNEITVDNHKKAVQHAITSWCNDNKAKHSNLARAIMYNDYDIYSATIKNNIILPIEDAVTTQLIRAMSSPGLLRLYLIIKNNMHNMISSSQSSDPIAIRTLSIIRGSVISFIEFLQNNKMISTGINS